MTDSLDAAIDASQQIKMVNVEGNVRSKSGSVKPIRFSVPADLTYEEALAATRGFTEFCENVIAQQQPKSKLALVHGALPR